MAEVRRTRACLRFLGDDLEPEVISDLLGNSSARCRRKGSIWLTPGGREMVARTGSWALSADSGTIVGLDRQIASIFDMLTDDLSVWRELSALYRGDIFAGVFLGLSNEGLVLEPSILSAIADRGLVLDLDIYSGSDESDDVGDTPDASL